MKPIHVSLPPAMREVIAARVKAGGFKDAGEYLCHLVCQDEVSASVQTFENELAERLRAERRQLSDADVQRIKREIAARRQEELRCLIAVGLEEANRGEVTPLDIEAIISDGKSRLVSGRTRGETVG